MASVSIKSETNFPSNNVPRENVKDIREEDKDLRAKEDDLVSRIWNLQDRVKSNFQDVYTREEITTIADKTTEVLQQHRVECGGRDREIEELKRRVSELEEEVSRLEEKLTKLEKRAQHAGTIDAGEAMKIMERQVAAFVLPETEDIGDNAMEDMHEYLTKSQAAKIIWNDLAEKCEMSNLWTKGHKNVLKNLIRYRNIDAHHTKFNFQLLQQAMLKKRPFHKKECEDIIRLFKTVNYLMKFGIIASEFIEVKARSDECTKDSVKLMHRAKIWDKRNVQNFQDIKLKEAKKHVTRYFSDVNDSIWSDTIDKIDEINRPRFGMLVKVKVAEVLKDVPEIFEEIQEYKTLSELVRFSKKGGRWKDECWKDGNRWCKLMEVICWTDHHKDALEAMESLLPDNQQESIDPLPLHIAKLHVADFVEKDELWDACSEIFKIFEWKKKKDWEYD